MGTEKESVRAIENGQSVLRLYRFDYLKDLYYRGGESTNCMDDDTDEKVRSIDKALSHLKKAKKIIKGLEQDSRGE